MLTIRHGWTRIERLVTANDDPSYRMSICGVLQINIRYDGSSFFFVTSRSIGVESCRFDNICNPLSQTLSEYILFSCKLTFGMRFHVIRDGFSELRHHNTSKPRIDFRFDDSSTAFDDSQRFGCIGQPSKLRSREYKK